MTPEGKVKRDIARFLDTLSPQLWYYKAQDRFTSGIPDFIVCYYGVFLTLEVKAPVDFVVRGIQKHVARKITAAGGGAHIVHSLSETKELIRRIDEHRRN